MPKSALKWCKEIGMYAIDRGRGSCKHRTKYCELYCYNIPFYRCNGKMLIPRDEFNDMYWNKLDGESFREELISRKKNTSLVRLMTRGEAFSTVDYVYIVEDLLVKNPDTLF